MNELIKLLAEQAKNSIPKDSLGVTDWIEAYNQKFAELIVRECVGIAQDRAAFDGFPPNDVNHIISEIKEHFGVEE